MNYFLGGLQPVDPVGYWLKAHEHADVACFITLDGTECVHTACGKDLPKASAIQGRRGVRFCEGCVAKVKARIARIDRQQMEARSVARGRDDRR